ncbi:hypothetical protein ACFL9U_03850 [Thermodesulfobacteriota bacterium]
MAHIITQVYEIQSPFEAEMLIGLGVDHIGSVIVSEEKWRVPSVKQTFEIVGESVSKSSLIPLFSNLESISRVLEYYRPDILHFCEAVNRSDSCENFFETQRNIKERFPEIKIMRSLPIPPREKTATCLALELARVFEPVSDYFLTDTLISKGSGSSPCDQPVEGFVGITGQTCDWDVARRLVESCRIPVILAGGISPENVFNGILSVKPAGIDSCTLTNVADHAGRPVRFKKDPLKVKRLIEAVRRAEKVI